MRPIVTLAIFLVLTGCSQSATPTPRVQTPTPVVKATDTSLPPTATPTATLSPTLPPKVADTPTATATPSALAGTVNELLRVRGGPGTSYATLGKLPVGTKLTLLARSPDGLWFQIAYPPDSNQRGWVIGEFLQVEGTPDALPTGPSPPTPALTPTPSATATPTVTPTVPVTTTVPAAEACASIPDQTYGTLPIVSAPTDRPAELHPDLNLGLRGYAPTKLPKALIDLPGGTDASAPRLRGLFGDGRVPAITNDYQVYTWDWNASARGPLIDDPEVTLLGVQTTTGEILDTPNAGGDLGEGFVALVLYASSSRITLKYTREDNVVYGYTLHLEKVCVEPTLLDLYQQMNSAKRRTLPALRSGQPFGRATGGEIGIVIRDRGSFMDPRSRKDWWTGQ